MADMAAIADKAIPKSTSQRARATMAPENANMTMAGPI
jgi:hypothetical protein